MDRRRVRVATLAPGDLRASIAAFDAFVRHLGAMPKPTPEPAAEPDLACEPVPFEEAAK